ncbi:MAG: ribosome maturation factor RimM [Firmicutes bacterium]|nr:ribosome maturation factor RimM [Bacillota bacterium]
MLTIGEILKPQGIKGAVKVRPLTDDIHRFDALKSVHIDGRSFLVQSVNFGGGFVVLKLLGVDDRNAAELLRAKLLQVERADAAVPPEGAYFIADVVGCVLLDEKGKKLGVLTAVDSYGAADVITAKKDGKEFRFPFLQRIVEKIDISAKEFRVFRNLWQEVTVFDD